MDWIAHVLGRTDDDREYEQEDDAVLMIQPVDHVIVATARLDDLADRREHCIHHAGQDWRKSTTRRS